MRIEGVEQLHCLERGGSEEKGRGRGEGEMEVERKKTRSEGGKETVEEERREKGGGGLEKNTIRNVTCLFKTFDD